jgi:hypothetical protein
MNTCCPNRYISQAHLTICPWNNKRWVSAYSSWLVISGNRTTRYGKGGKVLTITCHEEQSGRRGTVYSFFHLGARWGWVVNTMPWLLYRQEGDLVPTAQEAGWAPGPVWTGEENRTARLLAIDLAHAGFKFSSIRDIINLPLCKLGEAAVSRLSGFLPFLYALTVVQLYKSNYSSSSTLYKNLVWTEVF